MLSNTQFYNEVSESIAKYRPHAKKQLPIANKSIEAVKVFREIFNDDLYDREKMYVSFLDRRNAVLDTILVSIGGTSGTVCDPKFIFREALIRKASNIILCHNHPSENCKPSQTDITLTRRFVQAALLLDMQLVDHIILAGDQHYSFADEGML